ncbi:MAG: hypothetical protein JWR60_1573 [Polaromonas sp.]|nr:hypothetical protein [Polaromonas sp.]
MCAQSMPTHRRKLKLLLFKYGNEYNLLKVEHQHG